jgi:hypothetical protein
LLGAAYFISAKTCVNLRPMECHSSRREDSTAKFLFSSENRLDVKLSGVSGHFCI